MIHLCISEHTSLGHFWISISNPACLLLIKQETFWGWLACPFITIPCLPSMVHSLCYLNKVGMCGDTASQGQRKLFEKILRNIYLDNHSSSKKVAASASSIHSCYISMSVVNLRIVLYSQSNLSGWEWEGDYTSIGAWFNVYIWSFKGMQVRWEEGRLPVWKNRDVAN